MDIQRIIGLASNASHPGRPTPASKSDKGSQTLLESDNGDVSGGAGRLELSTEENFANYTYRPYGEVSEELRQAGWIEQQEFQQSSHNGEGFVAVWERPVGGSGLGQMPYILLGVQGDKVIRTGTLPPGNESPEIIRTWVMKLALQMR